MGGSREEHVAWCKARALELLDAGDPQQAFASMVSDLDKHDETRGHVGVQLVAMMMLSGQLARPDEMRRWIEGFN